MAAKTTSKTQKAKPRSRVKASAVTQRPTYAELRQQLAESAKELQDRNRQLAEALQQQTATRQVLRVIASSLTELQPVLDTVIENAVRLAGAKQGHIRQYDGEFLRAVAYYNVSAEGVTALQETLVRPGRETAGGRAFLDRKVIHVPDVQLDSTFRLPPFGARSLLAVPLLREGNPIGTISIWSDTVSPFSERQIELVTTFADQAVIAIENVRLFKEIQERNAELREALEHQTATSEVLSIISRSPTDVQPVLDAIVESAARVCGIDDVTLRLRDGEFMVWRAHFGPIPTIRSDKISLDEPQYRWMREHGVLHIPDVRAQNDFPALGSVGDWRTYLTAPLRQRGELMGTLNARRMQVRPFSAVQIKLLETFADQAVIALDDRQERRECVWFIRCHDTAGRRRYASSCRTLWTRRSYWSSRIPHRPQYA